MESYSEKREFSNDKNGKAWECMKYREDRYGQEISLLGYGGMRYTRKGTAIDIDKVKEEIVTKFFVKIFKLW